MLSNLFVLLSLFLNDLIFQVWLFFYKRQSCKTSKYESWIDSLGETRNSKSIQQFYKIIFLVPFIIKTDNSSVEYSSKEERNLGFIHMLTKPHFYLFLASTSPYRNCEDTVQTTFLSLHPVTASKRYFVLR